MSVVGSNLPPKRSERLYQKHLLNDLKANLESKKLKDQTKPRDAVPNLPWFYADDAAVAAHSPSHLQFLMDRFANECTVFGLIISTRSISKSQHKKLHRLLSLPSTIN